MTQAEANPNPENGAWTAQQLRLTLFSPQSGEVDSSRWWTDAVGLPPETRTEQPRAHSREDVGILPDRAAMLALQVQPSRIDWILRTAESPAPTIDADTIGEFEGALREFLLLTGPWLTDAPATTRVALGAVLLQPSEDVRRAYDVLQQYLNISIDPNTSDFQYMINHPTTSEILIDTPRINRLTTWSSIIAKHASFTIPGSPVATTTIRYYAARLELDVNTDADRPTPITRDLLPDVVSELQLHAVDISRRGWR